MSKVKEKRYEYGLIVEGLIVLSAFFFATITILFFLNKQVDFSIKDRQINFDYERAGLYSELPVMVLTADGNPILKTQTRINDLFRTYSEIASRNSIVGYPLCMILVESEFISGNIQLTRLSNYEYDCNTFSSVIPDCGRDAIDNLHNVNGETKQYFVVSFYLKNGDLISNKCAVARGTYKEILEPPFTVPSYIPPTIEPTVEPTVQPTIEPTIEPTIDPTIEPTIEPTVQPTNEPTIEPTVEPTVQPTNEPTIDPTIEPTEQPTIEPTIEPTEIPTETPYVTPSEEPEISEVPVTTPASEEPPTTIFPIPSEGVFEFPFPENSSNPNYGFISSLGSVERIS